MKYMPLIWMIVLAAAMAIGQAHAAPPSCYPYEATASSPQILSTPDGQCVVWACDTGHKWTNAGVCGTTSEAVANYVALVAASLLSHSAKDALWNQVFNASVIPGSADDNLLKAAIAYAAPVTPPPSGLLTTDTKVYGVSSSNDFNILSPVGTILLGITCDTAQSVTQGGVRYYVVPAKSVTWTGTKRLRVYGKCD